LEKGREVRKQKSGKKVTKFSGQEKDKFLVGGSLRRKGRLPNHIQTRVGALKKKR